MAITNNGTKNNLPANQLPSDYTKPAVTAITGALYPRELTLEVLKATVENADPKVTMANIIADAAIGITKQVTDILAADFVATRTVTAHAVFYDLKTNYSDLDTTGDYQTTTAPKYICKVKLFIKTAA